MIDVSGHLRDYKNELGIEDTTAPVIVNCCGYQKFITRNFTINRPQGRVDYQLIYVSHGTAYFTVDGTEYEAKEGCLFFFRPHEPQKYHYLCSTHTQAYWIHFTGADIAEVLDGFEFPPVMELSSCFYEELETLYKKIMVELQLRREGFIPMTTLLFRQLLLLIHRNQKELAGNRTSGNDLILSVMEYMHAHYRERITVEVLAGQCNLSPYRFIHNFKQFTGKSPIDYLIQIRINKAKELLIDSHLPVSEIAEITGYENPLYFSRLFHKNTGVPPTAYRRLNT